MNILIVDDNYRYAEMLRELLRNYYLGHHEIIIAPSPSAVLRHSLRPDFLITDLNIPEMKGHELITRMLNEGYIQSTEMCCILTAASDNIPNIDPSILIINKTDPHCHGKLFQKIELAEKKLNIEGYENENYR